MNVRDELNQLKMHDNGHKHTKYAENDGMVFFQYSDIRNIVILTLLFLLCTDVLKYMFY